MLDEDELEQVGWLVDARIAESLERLLEKTRPSIGEKISWNYVDRVRAAIETEIRNLF